MKTWHNRRLYWTLLLWLILTSCDPLRELGESVGKAIEGIAGSFHW